MPSRPVPGNFPTWLRGLALAWLLIWVPAYWRTWGPSNFLQLCDIAVILTCVGFLTNSRLLVSSQALSSLLVDLVWTLDASWRALTGHHLLGGTEYFFDPHYPLWIRLLSLFHVAMPLLLLWSLHRVGYDRRGFALQSADRAPGICCLAIHHARQKHEFRVHRPFLPPRLGALRQSTWRSASCL